MIGVVNPRSFLTTACGLGALDVPCRGQSGQKLTQDGRVNSTLSNRRSASPTYKAAKKPPRQPSVPLDKCRGLEETMSVDEMIACLGRGNEQ